MPRTCCTTRACRLRIWGNELGEQALFQNPNGNKTNGPDRVSDPGRFAFPAGAGSGDQAAAAVLAARLAAWVYCDITEFRFDSIASTACLVVLLNCS